MLSSCTIAAASTCAVSQRCHSAVPPGTTAAVNEAALVLREANPYNLQGAELLQAAELASDNSDDDGSGSELELESDDEAASGDEAASDDEQEAGSGDDASVWEEVASDEEGEAAGSDSGSDAKELELAQGSDGEAAAASGSDADGSDEEEAAQASDSNAEVDEGDGSDGGAEAAGSRKAGRGVKRRAPGGQADRCASFTMLLELQRLDWVSAHLE